MKKVVKYTGLCIALISACLTFTACADEPVNVTMSQIYDANQTTALLQTFDKVGVVATDRNEVKTETYLDGAIYYQSVTTTDGIIRECYNKQGTVGYQKDVDNAYYALFLQEDALKEKSAKAYESQVFDDKTVALQEEILSATVKGNGIQVKTKLSAENSAILFTADGYAYEEGERIETEYVLEKNTNLVLTAKRITVKPDGATTLYENVEQKTRISPDGEIASLKARVQAVESNTNLRKITVAMDPNTIYEQLYSAYATDTDKFKIDLGIYYPVLYTDDTCQTVYQYTAGDERKAFIKLFTKKVIPPIECDFTMQDIIDANDIQTWLQSCHSVKMEDSNIGQNKKTFYVDNEKLYGKESNAMGETVSEIVMLADFSLTCEKRGDAYRIGLNGFVTSQIYKEMLDFITTDEVIQGAQENAGKLLLTTKVEDSSETDKYWMSKYVLDARTYRMESCEIYEVYPNGTNALIRTIEISVDEEAPTGATELYQRLTATENVRRVVVIINPDTMDVEVRRFNILKGDTFYASGYSLYTDSAFEQVFVDSEPYDSDLLLYARVHNG